MTIDDPTTPEQVTFRDPSGVKGVAKIGIEYDLAPEATEVIVSDLSAKLCNKPREYLVGILICFADSYWNFL